MAQTSNSSSKKTFSKEDLELCDKSDLIDTILRLDAQNLQLKNIIAKADKEKGNNDEETKRKGKPFDFSKSHKRHILLKLYYLGWEHDGFAVQIDTNNTIESHLFNALIKSCCIPSREESNYHRCGRTDKGVSAFSQVISLDIRSKLEPQDQHKLNEELLYCKLLNRLLPKSIRCVSWAPVANEFSARFDCKSRTYKYFFPRGNLDIEAMDKAAKYVMGNHDFRNLCKMDVANGVVNFTRSIDDAKVATIDEGFSDNSGYDMCELVIKSRAFLWHQIRAIMGVLLLVGQGREKPQVIVDLLDVERYPSKPQYNLAHELPLNLYQCDYDDVNWFVDKVEMAFVVKTLQENWAINNIKSVMTVHMLRDLEKGLDDSEPNKHQADCLLMGITPKLYQPLMKRTTCESLENRIKHFEKKRRIESTKN